MGEEEGCECRPLGFLLGLPFALLALILSLVGAVIWVLGSILSCLCPCCICCAGLANLAVSLVKLPESDRTLGNGRKIRFWEEYWVPGHVATNSVTNVVVESDCIEAVKLLDGKNYDGDQFKKLITEI
ncbi:hypothetical protein GmHk_13G038958 [Glycine max]|nr:hypothetical protein GmHk_13G038958 [Glycine max]